MPDTKEHPRPILHCESDECSAFIGATDALRAMLRQREYPSEEVPFWWDEDYPYEPVTQPDAVEIIQHAIAHLRTRLRRYLIPQVRPTTEQVAMSLLKGLAGELENAGKELGKAAWGLKEKGAISAANRAHQASVHALKVAGEVG